jgi:hypothetical protein
MDQRLDGYRTLAGETAKEVGIDLLRFRKVSLQSELIGNDLTAADAAERRRERRGSA